MASIRDLKQSITQMSYMDAMVIIRRSRDSRRIPKKSAKAKSKSPKKSRVINPFDLVKGMTAEQKANLRKELLGE